MVHKNNSYRDYKYTKVSGESDEIFKSGMQTDYHETSHINIRDLILTKGRRRKRTWIVIGVASVIVAAILIAVIVLLTKGDEDGGEIIPQPPALTLGDVLYSRLHPRSFNATWTSGNELLYRDVNGNLIEFNVDSKQTKILLAATDLLMATAFEFKLSADKKYLLVVHDQFKSYRYSYTAKHTIIELSSQSRIELKIGESVLLQLVEWSPVGNALVFVTGNNIYYKSGADNENEPIQITTSADFIYNGVPDWVYEEEVFSSNKALWFSPDGRKLAYARFDDTKTPAMVVPIYGEPGNLLYQYPRGHIVKYPKAGSPNPIASLLVVDLEAVNGTTDGKTLEPPDELKSKQPILSAVNWASNTVLTAIWMNRVQNESAILAYVTEEPYGIQKVRNLQQSGGWLELFTAPIFNADGSQMALILPKDQGNNSGAFRHLCLIDRKESSGIRALTSGSFVVIKILDWDFKKNLIYYLANTATDSAVQHVYSISTETKQIKCISCDVHNKNKNACLYNTAQFSTDFSYYVLSCEGPDVPEIALYNRANKRILEWDDNEELVELIHEKQIPVLKKMSFEIADGFTAQVSLKLPANMDYSGKTKYPMLVNVYAGPDSIQVTDKFNLDWGSYLAANKSIIYATIDGRGSGLKGDKILFAGYRRLGTVEIVDQINVTSLIQKTLPYVDGSRTGIWGWSYGGYASGMALATDTEGIFKCGISVAPVTDWALYDSIYTERFMGLPYLEDNAENYREAQLFSKYEGLRDKQYFLIHGTYDDNVHYQQSMLWAKVLEQKDILFRQLSYTDEDHGLGAVRRHLYHSLENFLDECFITEKST